MKRELGNVWAAFLGLVLIAGIVLAAAVGWVWNIVKLMEMTFDPITGMIVVRIIGIFIVPLGCIVGWF